MAGRPPIHALKTEVHNALGMLTWGLRNTESRSRTATDPVFQCTADILRWGASCRLVAHCA